MDDKKKNNSDYGLSLQKAICNCYEIEVNEWAAAQFKANYNDEYEEEFNTIIPIIFKTINRKRINLMDGNTKMQEMDITLLICFLELVD